MTKRPRLTDDEEYTVGYKRPPLASRFQKGQSGNPRGRPRGASNLRDQVMKPLLKRIVIRENGLPRRTTTLEAISTRAVNEALQGRMKSFIDLFRFLKAAGLISLEELDDSSPVYFPTNVTVRIGRPDGRQEVLNARDRPKSLPEVGGPKKDEPPR